MKILVFRCLFLLKVVFDLAGWETQFVCLEKRGKKTFWCLVPFLSLAVHFSGSFCLCLFFFSFLHHDV